MSNESDLQEIEVSISQAEQAIATYKILERLYQNADFREIILKGYFEDTAIQLVLNKSHPACQTPEIQADIIKDIDSVGRLKMYFTRLSQNARTAEQAIEADSETRAEILQEDADSDDSGLYEVG